MANSKILHIAAAIGAASSPIGAAPAATGEAEALSGLSDETCLAAAIYYEARSEPEAGQRAVAQVVLNRLDRPRFPKTVCGVVFQGFGRQTGCQFSFTCDGSMARLPTRPHWQTAQRIAREALAGRRFEAVGDATHYHTRAIQPYWASSLQKIGAIGAHLFYVEPDTRAPARQPFILAADVAGLAKAEQAPKISRVSGVRVHRGVAALPIDFIEAEAAREEAEMPSADREPDGTPSN